MVVEYLGIDFRTRRELHRDPTWAAAKTAIELLDGENARAVRLSTRAGTSLSIGGAEGAWVVRGVRCTGERTSLMGGTAAGPELTKAVVLRAAALFFQNGTFDAALTWDGPPGPVAPAPWVRHA